MYFLTASCWDFAIILTTQLATIFLALAMITFFIHRSVQKRFFVTHEISCSLIKSASFCRVMHSPLRLILQKRGNQYADEMYFIAAMTALIFREHRLCLKNAYRIKSEKRRELCFAFYCIVARHDVAAAKKYRDALVTEHAAPLAVLYLLNGMLLFEEENFEEAHALIAEAKPYLRGAPFAIWAADYLKKMGDVADDAETPST